MPARRRRPIPSTQEIEWLTPAPDGSAVQLAWPQADGPFLLTCHLARVEALEGRAVDLVRTVATAVGR